MDPNFKLIWWVLGLPLLGFLFQALGGKIVVDGLGPKIGRKLLGAVAVAPIALAFLIAIDVTRSLASLGPENRLAILTLFEWINLQSLAIPFEVRVDALSMTMTLIITGVGTLIHLYATAYMAEDRDFPRFFTYLNLFIAFMLVLVLGNNLAMLFIGWEGVGLCSYLLIGYWYKEIANAKAANKAFIVNRIGDVGLALGMFLLVVMMAGNADKLGITDGRWLSYDHILPAIQGIVADQPGIAAAIALLLFIGAMGKSAQFPLYVWLPDAMAGPTPVSALIHAATMVTAGVFLVNRMHPVFEASPIAGAIVAGVGAVTALVAALIAFGQSDIKKVLAFSTVSQLGYMFMACGVGAYWAGIFHVTTHAFFKALLFLGSGAVIHAMAHNQDMRNYGNLNKYIKITGATMIIGWLAIAGVPGLAGFWSKEAIIGSAFSAQSVGGVPVSIIAGWVALVTAALTAAYMTRMTMLTFFGGQERWRALAEPAHEHHAHHAHADHAHHGPDEHGFFMTDDEAAAAEEPEGHHHALDGEHKPHEVPWEMWAPLAVLAVASLVGGWLLNSVYPLQEWLYPGTSGGEAHGPIPHAVLIGLSVLAAAGGIAWGIGVYGKGMPEAEGFDQAKWSPFRLAAEKQFHIDSTLSDGSTRLGGMLGTLSWKVIDVRLIDGLVNGIAAIMGGLGGLLRKGQTGFVRSYALVMQLGVLAIVGYVLYSLYTWGGGP